MADPQFDLHRALAGRDRRDRDAQALLLQLLRRPGHRLHLGLGVTAPTGSVTETRPNPMTGQPVGTFRARLTVSGLALAIGEMPFGIILTLAGSMPIIRRWVSVSPPLSASGPRASWPEVASTVSLGRMSSHESPGLSML